VDSQARSWFFAIICRFLVFGKLDQTGLLEIGLSSYFDGVCLNPTELFRK
jgi:hypothetical protein